MAKETSVLYSLPPAVRPYLLPSERIVMSVHRHPVLLVPALVAVAASAAIVGLQSEGVIPGRGAVLGAVAAVLTVSCGWLAWMVLTWSQCYFVITRSRLMLIRGGLRRSMSFLLVKDVADIRVGRNAIPGMRYSFGSLTFIRSEDARPWKVNGMPYPAQLYLELADLAFPEIDPRMRLQTGLAFTPPKLRRR
jgi:hypothetical protein